MILRRILILLPLFAASASAFAESPSAFTPHRAIYEMRLNTAKNGSDIADVSGKMFFEWADACDGWAVQQRMQMHFSYAQGDESDMRSTSATWESKDGKKYRFNMRRTTDGKETENYRGNATLSDKGGRGNYEIPRKKTVELPANSLFPSAHTFLVLQKAQTGEKLFTRPVFDGSDEEGLADVSAFVGAQHPEKEEKDSTLRKNPLLKDQSWPIRMAFFKPKSETGTPDYEMNLSLLPNGVAKSMLIDYGDFSVRGELISLEALPASGC
jgi:hypothetical protein